MDRRSLRKGLNRLNSQHSRLRAVGVSIYDIATLLHGPGPFWSIGFCLLIVLPRKNCASSGTKE